MLKNISIAKKLPALFAILTTISVVSVGMLSYMEISRSMERDVLAKVGATEEALGNTFERTFARIRADLKVMAESNISQDAIVRLGAGFENIAKEGKDPKAFLQKSYITDSAYPKGERHRADEVDDGSYYSKFHPKYHSWFRNIMEEYGYYDIFLVDLNGNVVYSVFKEDDFAANINGPLLRGSGLTQAVNKATEADGISMTDFEPYAPSAGALAAFSGIPVKDKFGSIIGALVVQLLPAPFVAILDTDTGFNFPSQGFILGSDQKIRFSAGVEQGAASAQADYFIGSDLARAAMNKGRGVEITVNPDTGEDMITAFGKHIENGIEMMIVWQVRYDDAMEALTSVRNQVGLVSALTLIVMTVLGFLIARSISRPLQDLQSGLQRFVKSGDLSIRVGTDAGDEVGQSTRAVDEILEMTQRSMARIKEGNDLSGEAAEKMMSAAKVMSANAETQSSSVEELSSSVEETESQVRSNAEAAREANDLVVGTSRIVQDGKEKINRMVDSMDNIKSSSADIAKIIKVIDEIAFQTNLLALNAAVEAARAGQHGRGFAVVAAEVRNLAGRSAKAAQETSELIVGSSKRVEAGVEVSNQAREAFDKIASDIASVTDLVGKISAASDEQARGVTYINRAIQEISDAAMTNAVRAEELTVVAGELSQSNLSVSRQIQKFDLGGATPRATRQSPKKSSAPIEIKQENRASSHAAPKSSGQSYGQSMNGVGVDMDERGLGQY